MDEERSFEISYNNEQEHIKALNSSYRFIDGSSYKGHHYKYKNLEIYTRYRNGSFSFEAFPGIIAMTAGRIPDLAVYSQRINPRYGTVIVNPANGTVSYRMESFYSNKPITAKTLMLYEKVAEELFNAHGSNLRALACGKTLNIKEVKEERNDPQEELIKSDFTESIDICRGYLSNESGHNLIGEAIDGDKEKVFSSQVLTNDESYKLNFVFENDGIFTINAYYSTENACIISPEYEYMASSILNEANSDHMTGSLRSGLNEKTGVSCSISTSLLDGALKAETIDKMEKHVFLIMDRVYGKLSRAIYGLPESKDDTNDIEEIKEMIDSALERAKDHSLPLPKLPLREFDGFKSLFDRTNAKLKSLKEAEEIIDDDDEQEDSVSMADFLSSMQKETGNEDIENEDV